MGRFILCIYVLCFFCSLISCIAGAETCRTCIQKSPHCLCRVQCCLRDGGGFFHVLLYCSRPAFGWRALGPEHSVIYLYLGFRVVGFILIYARVPFRCASPRPAAGRPKGGDPKCAVNPPHPPWGGRRRGSEAAGGRGGGDPTSKEVASWGEGGGGRRSCPSSVFVCARHSGRSSGGCASWELGSIPSQRRRREHHREHVDCRLPASGEGGGHFSQTCKLRRNASPGLPLGRRLF